MDQLRRSDTDIVIFGSSLDEQDSHIADVINATRSQTRRVAVAIYPGSADEVRRKKAHFLGKLQGFWRYDFFDSTTHPLGDPALQVAAP